MAKCVHKGCGKTITTDSETCSYHPGPPIFHEGQKGSSLFPVPRPSLVRVGVVLCALDSQQRLLGLPHRMDVLPAPRADL